MRFEFPEEVEVFTAYFLNEEGEWMSVTELDNVSRDSFLEEYEAEKQVESLRKRFPDLAFSIQNEYSDDEELREEEYENLVSGYDDYCYEQWCDDRD